MPKLYRKYISPFDHLLSMFLPTVYEKLYLQHDIALGTDDASRNNWPRNEQLWGSFHPFVSMWKDAKKTFQPYKSLTARRWGWDLLQPLRGIGNIVRGLLSFIVGLVLFPIGFPIRKVLRYLGHRMPGTTGYSVSWMINGIANTIRGITQIATTFLTWLRIPLRIYLTKTRPPLKLEEDNSMKKLSYLTLPLQPLPYYVTRHLLHIALREKCKKAISEGRQLPFGLTAEEIENDKYNLVNFFKMTQVMKLIPVTLHPYLRRQTFNAMRVSEKYRFINELVQTMVCSFSSEKEKEKAAITVLQKYRLYNIMLPLMVAHRRTRLSNDPNAFGRVLPNSKDIPRYIAYIALFARFARTATPAPGSNQALQLDAPLSPGHR